MGFSEKKIKITLDTGCVNTNPDPDLDNIFNLHENGEIEIYVPDGVVKDILHNDFAFPE